MTSKRDTMMRGCAFVAVAVIATVVTIGARKPTERQAGADSVFSKETFTYKTIGSTDIKADVYRLAGQDLRPVIMWIHGGALIMGSREMLPADERAGFLRAGYHLFDVFPDGLPPEGKPTGLQNPKVAAAFEVVLSFLAKHVGT